MIVIVMGVSGAGKTTIGRLLAEALGAVFLEGDEFHPSANLEKMRTGEPLDDGDRAPWLRNIAVALDAGGRDGAVVLACSALKRSYRDQLMAGRANVHLVYLRGDEAVIRRRLESRSGHFMPAALLASQLAALEEPADAITVDAALAPRAIVDRVLAVLTGGR
jgi:gluconokinase